MPDTTYDLTAIIDEAMAENRLYRSETQGGTEVLQINFSDVYDPRDYTRRLKEFDPEVKRVDDGWCVEMRRGLPMSKLEQDHPLRQPGAYQDLPYRAPINERDEAYNHLSTVIAQMNANGEFLYDPEFNKGRVELTIPKGGNVRSNGLRITRDLRTLGIEPGGLLPEYSEEPSINVDPADLEKAQLLPPGMTAQDVRDYGGLNYRDMLGDAFAKGRVAKNTLARSGADVVQIIAPEDAVRAGNEEGYLRSMAAKINTATQSEVAAVRESGTHQQFVLQMEAGKAQSLGLLPENVKLSTLPRKLTPPSNVDTPRTESLQLKEIYDDLLLSGQIKCPSRLRNPDHPSEGKYDVVKAYYPDENSPEFQNHCRLLGVSGIAFSTHPSMSREGFTVIEAERITLKEKGALPDSLLPTRIHSKMRSDDSAILR